MGIVQIWLRETPSIISMRKEFHDQEGGTRQTLCPEPPSRYRYSLKAPSQHGQFHPVDWHTGTQSTLAYQPDLRWELAAPFRAANSHERGRGMPV